MDFARTGNRRRYEGPYFERRSALGRLVLAECVEGSGRFLDDIINGVWAICEESTWVISGHNLADIPAHRLAHQVGFLDIFGILVQSMDHVTFVCAQRSRQNPATATDMYYQTALNACLV